MKIFYFALERHCQVYIILTFSIKWSLISTIHAKAFLMSKH